MATRHRGFSLIPNAHAADTPSASCEITEQNSSIWVRADVVVPSRAREFRANANVDTDTELKLQAALDRLMAGRTSFVIAHRLSTVRHATRILVLEHGQMVEQGTHPQLLDSHGRYAELYRLGLTWDD